MKFKTKSTTTFFALFVISFGFVFSQQIPFIGLTMKDGLSSYYVTDITQDKAGFLWFATKYGVSRFNGKKFSLYNKESSGKGLNSNEIVAIEADTFQNRVWLANKWDGLNVFDCINESFTSYKHTQNNLSLISNEISDIHVSSKGDVWIATNKGIELFNPKNQSFTHFNFKTIPDFPDDIVNTIAEGRNSDIYIGFEKNGFSIFDPKTKVIKNYKHLASNKNSIPDNKVNAIYAGQQSTVWVATDSGLSQFDIVTEKFKNFRDITTIHPTIKSRVFQVFQDNNGRVWVGTVSDLCYFNATDLDEIFAGKKDVQHMFIQDINQGISNPSVLCVSKILLKTFGLDPTVEVRVL